MGGGGGGGVGGGMHSKRKGQRALNDETSPYSVTLPPNIPTNTLFGWPCV